MTLACLWFIRRRHVSRIHPYVRNIGKTKGSSRCWGSSFLRKTWLIPTWLYIACSCCFSCFFSPLPWRRWTSLIFSPPTFDQLCTEMQGNSSTAKLNAHPGANCQEHCSLRAWSKTLAFLVIQWHSRLDLGQKPPAHQRDRKFESIESSNHRMGWCGHRLQVSRHL